MGSAALDERAGAMAVHQHALLDQAGEGTPQRGAGRPRRIPTGTPPLAGQEVRLGESSDRDLSVAERHACASNSGLAFRPRIVPKLRHSRLVLPGTTGARGIPSPIMKTEPVRVTRSGKEEIMTSAFAEKLTKMANNNASLCSRHLLLSQVHAIDCVERGAQHSPPPVGLSPVPPVRFETAPTLLASERDRPDCW